MAGETLEILIVDDQEVMRTLSKRALEQAGYGAVVYASSDQAIAHIVSRHEAGESPYPVAVIDYNNEKTSEGGSGDPSGGLKVVQAIRSNGIDTKIIGASGEILANGEYDGDRGEFVQTCDTFLEKPYRMKTLIENVRKYV